MKIVYIVTYNEKISGEAYFRLENAINFIESRSDNPKRLDNRLVWISDSGNYKIHLIAINDLD